MDIEKTIDGKTALLKVIGRLDTVSSPQLETLLNELSNMDGIILDFEKLEYTSSAGVRQIVAAHKKMNGHLKLKSVGPAIMDVFSMTGLDKRLNIE